MTNDAVYAAGLLNRALDPLTQPSAIREFLQAEFELLTDLIPANSSVVDFGCGTGRHLHFLSNHIRNGVGVDYEHSYIMEARRNASGAALHFITGDATRVPLRETFDFAMCLTNTWGTMTDKAAVLEEMRRLAPHPGSRFLSVYSETSIPPRREWYRRLGHSITEETAEYLATDGGFRSEHFSEARLRGLIGECAVRRLGDVAYLVTF